MDTDPRVVLQRLIEERKEDYAGLSRLIGRNAAYIQQFIKRGTPKRLDEKDRKRLAAYFGVSEALLGGFGSAIADEMISIQRLDVGASAGFGSIAEGEDPIGHIAFDPQCCGA